MTGTIKVIQYKVGTQWSETWYEELTGHIKYYADMNDALVEAAKYNTLPQRKIVHIDIKYNVDVLGKPFEVYN